MTASRGERNCNPLNIKRLTAMGGAVDTAWRGLAQIQQDQTFVSFASPIYGIRAAARIVLNYRRQGILSVEGVIKRWAPADADDNPTTSYVTTVATILGQDARFDWSQSGLHRLLRAMARVECGRFPPYPDCFWEDGVRLAQRKEELIS
jgi:hypothetical protein